MADSMQHYFLGMQWSQKPACSRLPLHCASVQDGFHDFVMRCEAAEFEDAVLAQQGKMSLRDLQKMRQSAGNLYAQRPASELAMDNSWDVSHSFPSSLPVHLFCYLHNNSVLKANTGHNRHGRVCSREHSVLSLGMCYCSACGFNDTTQPAACHLLLVPAALYKVICTAARCLPQAQVQRERRFGTLCTE